MKIYYPMSLKILVIFSLIFSLSCKKKDESAASNLLIKTNTATEIGQNWATLNGVVTANNADNKLYFEYDTTTSYRNSIIGNPGNVAENSSTTIFAVITGLKPKTMYYYRIVMVVSTDTLYGADLTFTTTNPKKSVIDFNPSLTYGSVSDIENNIYKTILIGTQTWMAENLKVTRYNDNTGIPFVPNITRWENLTEPGYCWFNNDSVAYGALYNWYTVNTGKLCPEGWHVPTDVEWTTLITYLDGDSVAAGKLKETGTVHWLSPNTGSSNETGFTALPGGYRNYVGTFGNLKNSGYWWTSVESAAVNADYSTMSYNSEHTYQSNSSKLSGFSVRCIKN
jgi:uncharacterized protein (TIGR02145 family)